MERRLPQPPPHVQQIMKSFSRPARGGLWLSQHFEGPLKIAKGFSLEPQSPQHHLSPKRANTAIRLAKARPSPNMKCVGRALQDSLATHARAANLLQTRARLASLVSTGPAAATEGDTDAEFPSPRPPIRDRLEMGRPGPGVLPIPPNVTRRVTRSSHRSDTSPAVAADVPMEAIPCSMLILKRPRPPSP